MIMPDTNKLPKVRFTAVRNLIFLTLFGAVLFGGGYYFGFKGFIAQTAKYPEVHITRINPPEQKTLDFNLFWKVWDTMHAKYYDKTKLTDSEMVYGAIRGMVAAVGDPYTVFLEPKQNKVVEEDLKGSFDGVGIQIGYKKGDLAVIAPLPGSPAEKAGVKPGDIIAEIKDTAKGIDIGTSGISLDEAIEVIRGKAGTSVTLILVREGADKPITATMNRSSIDVPSLIVKYTDESKEIANIKLTKFAAETEAEWETKVAELLTNPNLKGIVLDLRNNPGGYLQGAVDLASDFLESGDVVVKEANSSDTNHEYTVQKLGRFKNMKLVVLVNGGSASASEIFAGAMRDHNRAKLVGEKTFGKGTIQEPEQIDGGAGLHITIAKWLTPNGTWVHETGLQPDVEVKPDEKDTTKDVQLDKAVEILKSQIVK
jgi:carboxyl-terminal processing protease